MNSKPKGRYKQNIKAPEKGIQTYKKLDEKYNSQTEETKTNVSLDEIINSWRARWTHPWKVSMNEKDGRMMVWRLNCFLLFPTLKGKN